MTKVGVKVMKKVQSVKPSAGGGSSESESSELKASDFDYDTESETESETEEDDQDMTTAAEEEEKPKKKHYAKRTPKTPEQQQDARDAQLLRRQKAHAEQKAAAARPIHKIGTKRGVKVVKKEFAFQMADLVGRVANTNDLIKTSKVTLEKARRLKASLVADVKKLKQKRLAADYQLYLIEQKREKDAELAAAAR